MFVSLELSRSIWVATSLAPGSKKMSKHTLVGGDGRKLLDRLARLKTRAEQRIAAPVKVVAIHEVGLDGFWIHRCSTPTASTVSEMELGKSGFLGVRR